MSQEKIFFNGEGDEWFFRNKDALLSSSKVDWPSRVLELLNFGKGIGDVLEIGCANGYRLASLASKYDGTFSGVDISSAAIEDGKNRYPNITLSRGSITDLSLDHQYDIIIINYVLHWVDRNLIMKAMAQVDGFLKEGGYLVLGDFLPIGQERRRYHHLPNAEAYTYKQDYANAFVATGIYQEVVRICYDHDNENAALGIESPGSRAVCCALKKHLVDYYRVDT